MRAGLPQKEPELLERWQKLDLYQRLREAAKGRDKFVLHDGPPYANGNIHIGHALNKILKDVVTRSQQMLGYDSNYVPGWDCHGLPIEWKIEEENTAPRARRSRTCPIPAAINEFRQECRAFAEHWIDVQREEFKRLGVEGDWEHPYTTMSFPAEAQIARELMKFAANGTLYRGSKPVMWSVVEKTALAEAEVEYQDYTSDTVWVKFPVARVALECGASEDATALAFNLVSWNACVVIWTTTPWTIPGNRAISYSPKIAYGLYRVTDAPADNWAKTGDLLILADKLAADVFKQARVAGYEKVQDGAGDGARADRLRASAQGHAAATTSRCRCSPATTSPTMPAPASCTPRPATAARTSTSGPRTRATLEARGINPAIPYTVDENGAFTEHAPGFDGQARHQRQGQEGRRQRGRDQGADRGRHADRARPAEAPVSALLALQEAGDLPQHAAMVHRHGQADRRAATDTLRASRSQRDQGDALGAAAGREPHQRHDREPARLGDLAPARLGRADRRVRAREGRRLGRNPARTTRVNQRIADAFEQEGADAWFAAGARERFLGALANDDWKKVDDILDVWFDSGSTHAFTLEDPRAFPDLAGIKRKHDGGPTR